MAGYPQALVRTLTLAAVAGLLLIGLATPGMAQGVTGTVSGTVTDPQGRSVPGATVVLISEARGTRTAPVFTSSSGTFVVPNVTADTYTIQVEMAAFTTLKQAGVAVSPGSRVVVGTLALALGQATEVLTVTSEAPMLQTATGERSFTVTTDSVTNLPLLNRSYDALLGLAPGVAVNAGNLTPATRLGGGGDGNYMLDGATAMDPGVNRPATRVSVEAIAEVKLVTSTYQAEYGRSSGLQINAVTKSGSNQFHGSVYDVERNSRWNSNTRTNILNGDPKALQDERDWGFALGGPIGKPGRENKLFFYFNLEYNPRTFGNDVNRYRVPTLLERQGDFSATRDNQGNLYPFIRDPLLPGAANTCSSSNQSTCFKDGGVLGRIPKDRLYQTGLNILSWWPTPTIDNIPVGQGFNYEHTDAPITLLGYQPIIRVDYQPFDTLRGSFKFLEYQQPSKVIAGTIPGFNDTREDNYGIWVPAGTLNWTVNASTFFEASFGANFHHQEGCSVSGGEPNYCRNALPVSPAANRLTAGFGAIPYLFPDATVISPDTFSYEVINRLNPSSWDGTRVQAPPTFQWGTRVSPSPPNNIGPFGNFILDTRTRTISLSLTKVQGEHNYKTGYYYFRSYQRRGQGNILGTINFQNDTNNPLDTSYGFANAALGIFSSYSQLSRWGEGAYLAVNHEAFIQDNWRLNRTVTLDYGVRFIHQAPQYDSYGFSSNFLPERWTAAAAPTLYVSGCATNVYPCTAANRRAMTPGGVMLGPNSVLAVGTLVPQTGSSTNGVFAAGNGIADTNYTYPTLAVTPRVGAAWDTKGDQTFVVRGGVGLFYDRPQAQNIYNTVNNPPFSRNVTVRYGQLQSIGSAGLTTEAPPSLTVWQYDQKLPASVQWNTGVQMVLPYAASLDVAYTGQHSYDTPTGVNINSIDLGAAFLPANQNPAVATSLTSTDPATSYVATNPDLVRFYRGFGTITQQQPIGYRTYHSIQVTLTRRFRNGLLFGFNDTIGLSDKQQAALRLQHNADGTVTVRADQDRANELLGNNQPQAHIMRGHFVWQLPKLKSSQTTLQMIGHVINDWSLSGIWSGATGSAYTVGYSYSGGVGTTTNLTGSPDFAARIRVVGDPGSGCSSDRLRQFKTSVFLGPLVNSDGLESGNDYLKGCFIHSTDLALARTIQLGKTRSVQLRVDAFNVFNQAGITGRQTTMNLPGVNDPGAISNLPFDAAGNVIDGLSRPRGAGFGVATNFQTPRALQLQARFSF